ncbi:MAG: hypothetical protein PWR10_665 [Halanaerobiales bacterium]|nr:hypothetical protein [Halanaerobiales bacterium]
MKDKKDLKIIENTFNKEFGLYKRLLDLSRKQSKAIELSELEMLEKLLKEKEEIITEIDILEESLEFYKERIISRLDLNPKSWLKELLETRPVPTSFKRTAFNLIEVMESLYEIDQKNQQLIKKNRLKLMEQRKELKRGIHVNKSYKQRPRIYSSFIDKKG